MDIKRQIRIWGSRTFGLVLIVLATQHWGVPMYKQYFTPKKQETFIPKTNVSSGIFTVSFHEIGTLEAEVSVPVNAEAGGKIISLVADGKMIKTGDIIAELDTTDLERDVQDKELNYENALGEVDKEKSELEILRESNKTELEKAQAQADFDQTELERSKKDLEKNQRLAEEKLVRKSEVEQSEFEVRSKQLTVDKGQKDLALTKKSVQAKEDQQLSTVRHREFAVRIAQSALDDSKRQLNAAVIKAPASGLVVLSKDYTPDGRRKLQEGDSIRPRQTICTLPDLTSMQAKINVGESDAPKVKIGMPVLIRLEAVPKKVFHGTVIDVSSLATEPLPWESGSTPGRKNFEVTVQIKEVNPKVLKPGMTADAEFICDKLQKAIYVPIEAVTEQNGKTYVYVKKDAKYKKVKVQTGRHNDNFICITKGLRKDQTVYLRDPTKPLDDQEAGTDDQDKDQNKQDVNKDTAPMPDASGKK